MIALFLVLLLQAVRPPASISGTVIDADSPYRRPLADARIEVSLPERAPRVVRTGAEGQFSISDLASGSYRITVTANGFIRKSLPVRVAEGQRHDGIVLALQAASAIAGRVKDEYNVPAAHLIVEAMKVIYGPRGDRAVAAFGSTLTNDRGEFNLAFLDPGDYYLRVTSLPATEGFALPGNPSEDPARRIYPAIYYPGTRDASEAVRIHVGVGTRLKGFELKMLTGGLVGIQGHISTESSNTPVSTRLSIAPVGSGASVQKFETRSGYDGEFQISGIPVGTYVISAQTSLFREPLTVYRKFTIRAQERAFILKMSPGVTVNGQVIGAPGNVLDLRSAKVLFDSADPDLSSAPSVPLDANGAFQLSRMPPGDYAIRISGLPGNAYVENVTSGNSDILAQPLHLEFNPPAPIRVTLALDGGHLSGTVHDKDRQSVPGAKVVLVPDASRRAIANHFQTTETGEDGVFELVGIPPGNYTLFAWQYVEPNAYLDPSFLQRYESLGMNLKIAAGSEGTTFLPLIPLD